MDTNENICNKSIGRDLTNREGLAMSEVVGDFTCQNVGVTYFQGSTPTDGVLGVAIYLAKRFLKVIIGP